MAITERLSIDPRTGETPADVATRIGYYNYARLDPVARERKRKGAVERKRKDAERKRAQLQAFLHKRQLQRDIDQYESAL